MTSILKKVGAALGFAKAAAPAVMDTVEEGVNALLTTSVGKFIEQAVKDGVKPGQTGVQKFEQVVLDAIPLVQAFVGGAGRELAPVKQVEDVTRQAVQKVYNAVKSTSALSTALRILSLLGVR